MTLVINAKVTMVETDEDDNCVVQLLAEAITGEETAVLVYNTTEGLKEYT